MPRQEVHGAVPGGGIAGGGIAGKVPGGGIMPPGGGGKVLPSGNLVMGPYCTLAGNCEACVLGAGKGGYGADAAPE